MNADNLNQLWAALVVEELARHGITHFIIAPGSRSAPLAVAAARNSKVITLVHFDERGAAFAALGSGKSGKPAVLICTSGTALANCFPAVAEACLSATPLIIISADRPPELQNCGANQTMPQQGIFGNYVRFHETLPCPDANIPPEFVLTKIDALAAAIGKPGNGGVAHLNCMYREPLAPLPVENPWPDNYLNSINDWGNKTQPYTTLLSPCLSLSCEGLKMLSKLIGESRKGLLLIGRLSSAEEYSAAIELAESIHWPVFADIASNCRKQIPNSIHCYDSLLRSEAFRELCSPDLILHIGDTFVSKRLQEHLSSLQVDYIHINSRGDNRDPSYSVTHHWHADIPASCRQLLEVSKDSTPSLLLEKFKKANDSANAVIQKYIETSVEFTESFVAKEVESLCPSGYNLFIGNSMPVRDMDLVTATCSADRIQVNRGVSGIDGNIATAAGIIWASGKPGLAVIGDTTALHDMNSLAIVQRIGMPLVLVIINNHGGGIFSFLPVAQCEDVLETFFINRHGLHFQDFSAGFGLPYYRASKKEEFRAHLQNAISSGRPAVIEAIIEREVNVKDHRILWQKMEEQISRILSGN